MVTPLESRRKNKRGRKECFQFPGEREIHQLKGRRERERENRAVPTYEYLRTSPRMLCCAESVLDPSFTSLNLAFSPPRNVSPIELQVVIWSHSLAQQLFNNGMLIKSCRMDRSSNGSMDARSFRLFSASIFIASELDRLRLRLCLFSAR